MILIRKHFKPNNIRPTTISNLEAILYNSSIAGNRSTYSLSPVQFKAFKRGVEVETKSQTLTSKMETNIVSRNVKPTLYFDDRSPPVRSCLMLITILNIEIELKFVDIFKGEQMLPSFVENINGNHTVPALVDNEVVLTDSHAIMIYLCEKYGGKQASELYPSNDFVLRTLVLNRLFFEATVLFRRDSDLMSEIIKKGYNNVDIPFHKQKIWKLYDVIDGYLQKHRYVASNSMTIADVSFLTTLSTVDLMFQITEDKWPNLHKWYAEMKSLPSYANGNGVGLRNLKDTFEAIGKFTFPERILVHNNVN